MDRNKKSEENENPRRENPRSSKLIPLMNDIEDVMSDK